MAALASVLSKDKMSNGFVCIEKDKTMQVEFIGNKARMASDKHFGGKLDEAQMKRLVVMIIKNATHTGKSDRANAGHSVSRIIWGVVGGITLSVVLDGEDIKKNKATVISMYDVHNVEIKAKRFNMKKVG